MFTGSTAEAVVVGNGPAVGCSCGTPGANDGDKAGRFGAWSSPNMLESELKKSKSSAISTFPNVKSRSDGPATPISFGASIGPNEGGEGKGGG